MRLRLRVRLRLRLRLRVRVRVRLRVRVRVRVRLRLRLGVSPLEQLGHLCGLIVSCLSKALGLGFRLGFGVGVAPSRPA